MKFLNPGLLYALFALAIPIIIHLFNFQRFKKILFTQVRFLKNLQLQTRAQSRLKHLLVLAVRMLAFAFLVLAFAQPYIPKGEKKINPGKKAVSLYVDNSFSMDAVNAQGRLLEQAVQKAREIALAYDPTDRFQLITNAFEGRHQRFVSREELLENLEEVHISPETRKLSEVYIRQKEVLKKHEGEKIIYHISDFQESISDIDHIPEDTTISLQMVTLQSQMTNNIFVDSLWFESPVRMAGKAEKLKVRIQNVSDQDYENIPLKLELNGQQKAIASVSMEANTNQEVVMNYTADRKGIQYGKVSLTDYPLVYDDIYYFSYEIADSISVLCINRDKESWSVNSLFARDEFIGLQNLESGQLDYAGLALQNMIVLNGLDEVSSGLADELENFVRSGGSLFIFPSGEKNADALNPFLQSLGAGQYGNIDTTRTKASWFMADHQLYAHIFEKVPDNMDYPVAGRHYVITAPQRASEQVLLRLQDGHPYVSRYPIGKGCIYLAAVPADNPDFIPFGSHGLNILTLYQAALQSKASEAWYYVIGRDESIAVNQALPAQDGVFSIHKLNTEGSFIPEQRKAGLKSTLLVHDQVKEAGHYTLSRNQKDIRGLAFNFERSESYTQYMGRDELSEALTQAGLQRVRIMDGTMNEFALAVARQEKGIPLWRVFILGVLLMLAIETALLRLWK